jgi:triphosphoribosyl-dephospho-CoA synthase
MRPALLTTSVAELDALEHRYLASLARESLVAEAQLTPKPGLVDRRGSGSHTDLSLEIIIRSAAAIEPFFRHMAAASTSARVDAGLRAVLAAIGREAESAMFKATGGTNSHKGAIWILGLLIAGASSSQATAPARVAEVAGSIARIPDPAGLQLVSHGDLVRVRYGAAGARGEACAGFPHVIDGGLPALNLARNRGLCEETSRLTALLQIMASLEDTCVLYRGGSEGLEWVQRGARAVLEAGGPGTSPGNALLHQLDRALFEHRLSPGGSADLLAATLFLDTLDGSKGTVREDNSPNRRTQMEHIDFEYPNAQRHIINRAHVGVVGSGDLEVLFEPSAGAGAQVSITTSVNGFRDAWRAVFDRFFSKFDGSVRIQVHDAGATPGSVLLRLEQAVEALGQ